MIPPILLPPLRDKVMKLYIVASDNTIGSMLAQEDENGLKSAIYYLSRCWVFVLAALLLKQISIKCVVGYYVPTWFRHPFEMLEKMFQHSWHDSVYLSSCLFVHAPYL